MGTRLDRMFDNTHPLQSGGGSPVPVRHPDAQSARPSICFSKLKNHQRQKGKDWE